MANITTADIAKLRAMTAAGLMDCKKALVESDGDFDKAIEILRKKGQKIASNRLCKEKFYMSQQKGGAGYMNLLFSDISHC